MTVIGPRPGRLFVDVGVALSTFAAAAFVWWRAPDGSFWGGSLAGGLFTLALLWSLAASRRPRRVEIGDDALVIARLGGRTTVPWRDVVDVSVHAPTSAEASRILVVRTQANVFALSERALADFDALVAGAKARAPTKKLGSTS